MLDWKEKFAGRATYMKRSSIREILKLTQSKDIISFAGGLPAPELFPVERIKEAADHILTHRSGEALQYSTTEGSPELRDLVAERMTTRAVRVTRDDVLIVNGGQQAIDLIGRVMLNAGDWLVIENPTYLGMLQAWTLYNLNFSTIPTDSNGLRVEPLDGVLRSNPKLMYLVPNFQNPQGITLSHPRRVELVKMLAKYGAVVVEDNPYGELRYSGDAVPCLYELDAQNAAKETLDGHVIYVGSFSKILAPGFRLGWIAGPPAFMEKVIQVKQAADLHTSTFSQLVTYEVLRDGFVDKHIAQLREVYRQRRDAMLQAMDQHFPEEARWSRPNGGLFLMVHLPGHLVASDLLKDAIQQKVAFVPGDDFHVGGLGKNTFRLNFSNAQPDRIEEGIKRLGNLLKHVLARQSIPNRAVGSD